MRKNGNKKSKKAAENTPVESGNAAVHAENVAVQPENAAENTPVKAQNAAVEAQNVDVHAENVVTAKENNLATTPESVTRRYYNSFMNPLQFFFHENAAIHYNSFMLQPACYPTWRRAKYLAKSISAKQADYNFTRTNFTKEGNSEEVASKKPKDELRCQLLKFKKLL
jgi:hypothetical protein